MGRPKGFERQDVLQKAIQVFWKKGFADTSVQDLEKATGVNKSGLYSEFNDKQDLFLACLEHYIAESQAISVLTQEPYGWQNIENFLFMGQSCKGRKGCFSTNTVREIPILPPKAKTIINESRNAVLREVTKNLEAERVPSAESVAEIVMAFHAGNCLGQNNEEAEASTLRAGGFMKLLMQLKKSDAHTATW